MIKWLKNLFRKIFSKKLPDATPAPQPEPVPEEKKEDPLMVPYRWAQMELAKGIKEVAGKAHNERIIYYHSFTTYKASADEVPWCSSFICAAHEANGIKSTRNAGAKSWLNWGIELKEPVEGCVVVMSRVGGNHVGFFVKEDGDSIWVLGGNQSNKISVAKFDKSRVKGYRGQRVSIDQALA